MKKLFGFILACISFQGLFAQETDQLAATATGMNAHGKIYVVMAVVLTILAGLFLFLIRLDRKISKLEK